MGACVSFDCSAAGKLATGRAVRGIYAEAFRRPMPSGLEYTENVDPLRSRNNITWYNPRWAPKKGDIPDYMKAIQTLMQERTPEGKKQRKIRKDAVLVRSLVYQVSPVHFFPKLETWSQRDIELSRFEERGPLDMGKVNAWKETMTSYLQEKYGDALLSIELHLDENSPHLHAQIVPVTEDGRLSSKDLFTEKTIKAQLDELAAVCAPLGIERAREGGQEGRLNKKPEEWEKYRERERAKDIENVPAADIDHLPEELLPPPIPKEPEKPESPGLFATREEKAAYKDELAEYERKLEKYEEESSPNWRAAEQKKRILWRLNNDAQARRYLQGKVREAQAEAAQARAEAEFYRKEAQKAEAASLKAIPLIDVMERIYPGKFYQERDKTIWKTDDGRKIGVKGQLFIDNFDSSFSGKGAIDFVMKVDGCSVKQAIGKLRDYYGAEEVLRHIATVEPRHLTSTINACPSQPEPKVPAADPQKTDALKTWMKRDLAISPKTANYLIDTGQVYADERQNCVIPRPYGGAFIRGTVKLRNGEKNRFKQTLGSKKAGAGKLSGPQATPQSKSILCEGITDALALVDIYPDANIYIIGGNLYPELPPLSEPIYLAFDQDRLGQEHLEHYLDQYPEAEALLPPEGKDWSEWHKLEVQKENERTAIRKDYSSTPRPH